MGRKETPLAPVAIVGPRAQGWWVESGCRASVHLVTGQHMPGHGASGAPAHPCELTARGTLRALALAELEWGEGRKVAPPSLGMHVWGTLLQLFTLGTLPCQPCLTPALDGEVGQHPSTACQSTLPFPSEPWSLPVINPLSH